MSITSEKSYIPLRRITEFHHVGNIYEVTNAAIRRAAQLILAGGKSLEECQHHVVSAALSEVLNDKVHYKIESEEGDALPYSS